MTMVAVAVAVDVSLLALAVVAPARRSFDDASGSRGTVTVMAVFTGDGCRRLIGQH